VRHRQTKAADNGYANPTATAPHLDSTGQRPSHPAVATSQPSLYLRLLGDLQRNVDLNPELPDGALRGA